MMGGRGCWTRMAMGESCSCRATRPPELLFKLHMADDSVMMGWEEPLSVSSPLTRP